MAKPESGGGSYTVHCSQAVAEELRKIQKEASHQGRGKIVAEAFAQIVSKLETIPHEAGEEVFDLPAMRMQVRSVAVRPLVVHYGVCQDHPLVFIRGAGLLS